MLNKFDVLPANIAPYRSPCLGILAISGLPVTKVGINFDSTTGNIEDWKIEK